MAIPQARLSSLIPYGFVNNKSAEYIPAEQLAVLPSAPAIRAQLVPYNYDWWVDNRDAVVDAVEQVVCWVMDGYQRGATLVRRAPRSSLSGLEKHFDSVGAVRGVSLDIRSGEFLTLLGPSGSGKTTTLMMIAGFETPIAGDIAIDGRSIVGAAAAQAQHRHGVPELRAVPASDRGGEYRLSAEAARRRSRRRGRGGGRERWSWCGCPAIRRAIRGSYRAASSSAWRWPARSCSSPRLLLMDEPLGALDKQLRESLQLEMRRLHADLGITFIYVTHDQEEALTMSDRIAVMNEGLIAQVGSPEDLYDRPCDRFVAAFIGELNFLPGIVRGARMTMVVAECGGGDVARLCGGAAGGAARMLR